MEQAREVRRLSDGALGRFEAYLSHEMGLGKPTLESFAAVAERAGIAPERSLFIDDKQSNVDAARALGFIGIRFTTIENLRDELILAGLDKQLPLPALEAPV